MKKQFYIVSILILLILGGAFYWYEYRPSLIKKVCINSSMPDAANQDLFWNSYKFCLADKGLKE
ncbi:hypothetical protein KKC83_01195 [Patescibacteria group bacterium]|nr:hypothetical protein [Candidatus Falkowbacteria bacterium]MBU3905748.1 hypothetical protein [Patescibacteria group bacterium]MBU4015816.1 hypothetical protein [Patescibacteria group bacterium]MBU4026146.1 hypothetical protein [Patescibacteria group bacterium]MBU4072845.1 hypothetical protein [Patescibacteria group bacterium]